MIADFLLRGRDSIAKKVNKSLVYGCRKLTCRYVVKLGDGLIF